MSVDHAPKPQPHTTEPNTLAPTTQPQTQPHKPQPTKRIGRPPIYTDALAASVLKRVADGETLTAICKDNEMPDRSVVAAWARGESGAPESFALAYARARQQRAEVLSDEVLRISDAADDTSSASVHKAKLRADNRKWVAARLDPGRWGDRVQHDVTAQRVADAPPAFDPLEHLDDDDRQLMRRLAEKAVRRSQLGQGQK